MQTGVQIGRNAESILETDLRSGVDPEQVSSQITKVTGPERPAEAVGDAEGALVSRQAQRRRQIHDREVWLRQSQIAIRVILVGLLIRENAADSFGITDGQFSYEPYALMLRRNDSAFRLVANRALARLYRSGDIAPIYSKWFGAVGRPSPPLLIMYRLFALPE